MRDVNPLVSDLAVTELLRHQRSDPRDDAIAQGTRYERLVRFDECHANGRIGTLEGAGAAYAGKPAANDDDLRRSALRERGQLDEARRATSSALQERAAALL